MKRDLKNQDGAEADNHLLDIYFEVNKNTEYNIWSLFFWYFLYFGKDRRYPVVGRCLTTVPIFFVLQFVVVFYLTFVYLSYDGTVCAWCVRDYWP